MQVDAIVICYRYFAKRAMIYI